MRLSEALCKDHGRRRWSDWVIQPQGATVTETSAKETGRLIVSQLQSAETQQIELKFKSLKPMSVACAIGVKSAV